jgi:hypothetical protein
MMVKLFDVKEEEEGGEREMTKRLINGEMWERKKKIIFPVNFDGSSTSQ